MAWVRLEFNSSNLKKGRYDTVASVLEITFQNGRVYRYIGVQPGVVADLLTAESQGQYHAEHIKGHYPYMEVTL